MPAETIVIFLSLFAVIGIFSKWDLNNPQKCSFLDQQKFVIVPQKIFCDIVTETEI